VITRVLDESGVGEARRSAIAVARAKGADSRIQGRIALVVTEIATNLLKHAGAGMIVVDGFADVDGSGIEILAFDTGAGMADLARCLEDGYSTAGSPGTGLGAIARQSDHFAVYSREALGTALMARFLLSAPAAGRQRAQLGFVRVPYPGESVCGDCWASCAGRWVLVADGSGHGVEAAHAAEIAIRIFSEASPAGEIGAGVRLLERIHKALAPTRGAAVALAAIDDEAGLVRFVGIGNIAGTLVTNGQSRHMVSHNGTAGHVAPRIREFTYPFTGTPLVILHSDGLGTKWALDDYPGLAACHPSLIAAILYRDHRRERDDATVVALRAS
jgi:anti-sigma regulatory factor (Ser/Thr protein kinase)